MSTKKENYGWSCVRQTMQYLERKICKVVPTPTVLLLCCRKILGSIVEHKRQYASIIKFGSHPFLTFSMSTVFIFSKVISYTPTPAPVHHFCYSKTPSSTKCHLPNPRVQSFTLPKISSSPTVTYSTQEFSHLP